jgi:hypothetical protein
MNRRAASLVIAVGAVGAAVTIGAPIASAGPDTTACQAGQIVIDGQCSVPPPPQSKAPAPDAGNSGDSGAHAH